MVLIAVVDRANTLRVSSFNPDGLDLLAEVRDARWPMWLPNSTRVAYSSTAGELASVEVRDVASPSSPPTTLYQNAAGATGLLGPGTPHYLCPSPDGRWLGIVGPAGDSLALSIVDVATGEVAATVPGAPILSAWSSDSRLVAVHAGPDLVVVDVATGESRSVVASGAIGFRAPAVGAAGELVYVTRRGRLLTLNWDGIDAARWAPGPVTRGGAVSVFRPGHDELWMGSAPMGNTGLLSLLSVARQGDTRVRDVYKGPFCAFSWSPSGETLVIAVPRQPGDDRTSLVAIDHDGTALAECETFLPSDDQRALWSFFDQHSHSHGSWLVSGGDEYFAFSGRHGADRVSPSFGATAGNRILLWRPRRGEPLVDLCAGEIVIPAPASVNL